MADPHVILLYCLADKLYFDAPDRIKDMANRYFLATCPVPDGWHRTSMHLWTVMEPAGTELPDQGWKIHVTSTPNDAPDVLRTVADICSAGELPSSSCAAKKPYA